MTSNCVDQDVLLARVLQEQERAFHAMLMAQIAPADKHHEHHEQQQQQAGLISTEGMTDEELARHLQQQDEEAYADGQEEEYQFDAELDVDYNRLSYEELNALGDVAGAVSKGLAPSIVQQLPRISAEKHLAQQCTCSFQQQQQQQQQDTAAAPEPAAAAAAAAGGQAGLACKAGSCKCAAAQSRCVVCQCEFEGGEVLKLLPGCGHTYHEECIDQWLAGSKDCPICHKEVSLSAGKDKGTAAA